LRRNTVESSLNPFRNLNKEEQEALESEVTLYGKFLGIPSVPVK
jgi:hypothetical protein